MINEEVTPASLVTEASRGVNDFIPLANRDAWRAIKGYFYQVGITVLRWLSLKAGEELVLECGEDIDLVSQALSDSEGQPTRLLEQVKSSEKKLTLRTSSARKSIAFAVQHRVSNPGLRVLFRFTTCACVATEKVPILADRTPGITAWEDIRQRQLPDARLPQTVAGIRLILSDHRKPEGVPEQVWQTFCEFVTNASDGEFVQLIQTFEWSTGQPPIDRIAQDARSAIIELRYGNDEEEAQRIYERLVFSVFETLSQPGLKTLTRDQLEQQARLPELAASQLVAFERLQQVRQNLEDRVTALERTARRSQQAIAHLAVEVGTSADIDHLVSTPVLDIPPLLVLHSKREKTVSDVVAVLNDQIWTAIHGGTGLGKTQLAVLVAHRTGTCAAWLRLTGLTETEAAWRLDGACEELSGSLARGDRRQWYGALCSSLDAGALIVVDDLPNMVSQGELAQRLLPLAEACREHGVRLLTTGLHRLPSGAIDTLSSGLLYEHPCPPFSVTETRELLEGYGAPAGLLVPSFVEFVNALAKQLPVFVVAIARFLKSHDWHVDQSALQNLLQGRYASGLSKETLDRLVRAVQDQETRQLLYRLNVVTTSFTEDDVRALANVPPPVDRPGERLRDLAGMCVQPESSNRYLVSPVFRSLGTGDLPETTTSGCHVLVAQGILRRRRIDIFQATTAIYHFTAGREHTAAGKVLAQALSHILAIGPFADPVGLTRFIWTSCPLPEVMPLSLRIHIRTLQAATRQAAGEPADYVLARLDSMLEEATEEEALAVVGAATLTNEALHQSDPRRANRYLRASLRMFPHITMPDGTRLEFPDEQRLELLIWANAMGIETYDDLRDWIATVEALSEDGRQVAFGHELAQDGCVRVSEALLRIEANRPDAEQNWGEALAASSELAERSRKLGLDLLWACAERVRIMVVAERCGGIDEAISQAGKALGEATDDARVRFLIREYVGRQLVHEGRPDGALEWLRQALGESTDAYPVLRVQALLYANRVVGPVNPETGLPLVREAVSLAESSEDATDILRAKALAELAILHWLRDDLHAAFAPWERAAELVLASKVDADAWRDLFIVFAHVSSYLCSMADHGEPRGKTPTGEPYAPPECGMFIGPYRSGRAALYDARRDCFLPAQVAIFAEGIGNDERAAHWTWRAIEAARESNVCAAMVDPGLRAMPTLLLDNRFAEALDIGVETGQAVTAFALERESGGDPMRPGFNVVATLGPREGEAWRRAEYNGAKAAALPIAFRLGHLLLTNREEGKAHAQEVAVLCRQMGAGSADPDLWAGSAELFDDMAEGRLSIRTLLDMAENYHKRECAVLSALARLCASLHPDCDLRDAFASQIYETRYFLEAIPQSATYRRVVVPFLSAFWRSRFDNMRFAFSAPRLVERQLEDAEGLPAEQRAQAIFRVISEGLGLKLGTRIREWLYGGDEGSTGK